MVNSLAFSDQDLLLTNFCPECRKRKRGDEEIVAATMSEVV